MDEGGIAGGTVRPGDWAASSSSAASLPAHYPAGGRQRGPSRLPRTDPPCTAAGCRSAIGRDRRTGSATPRQTPGTLPTRQAASPPSCRRRRRPIGAKSLSEAGECSVMAGPHRHGCRQRGRVASSRLNARRMQSSNDFRMRRSERWTLSGERPIASAACRTATPSPEHRVTSFRSISVKRFMQSERAARPATASSELRPTNSVSNALRRRAMKAPRATLACETS